MPDTLTLTQRLIQEHSVIKNQINQIADLFEDLAILGAIKDKSAEFTPYQYNFLNYRRINLRQNLVQFREVLELHYQQEKQVLQSLLGDPMKQWLDEQHSRVLQQLLGINELLLSLSPVGLLFNGPYLKHKIDSLGHTISLLNSTEDSLLEISGISLG